MSDLLDYAMPMMCIEKTMKAMHNRLLEQNMPKAQELAIQLVMEAKMLQHTLTLMKEQQDALREQAETVRKGIQAAESSRGTRRTAGAATSARSHGFQGGQPGRQRH